MRPVRRGFTLIELVVVVVTIGILAAVALLSMRQSRGRALVATLHSDLRNLAAAQEGHYILHGSYAPDLAQLPIGASPGVGLTVTSADRGGWGATADHAGAAQRHCAIFHGSPAAIPSPAVAEGVIACE